MNLYLLMQNVTMGYDTYDSVVVAAETEEEARLIHPENWSDNPWNRRYAHSWAISPEDVTVELLGVAVEGIEKGVILSSFNAG